MTKILVLFGIPGKLELKKNETSTQVYISRKPLSLCITFLELSTFFDLIDLVRLCKNG